MKPMMTPTATICQSTRKNEENVELVLPPIIPPILTIHERLARQQSVRRARGHTLVKGAGAMLAGAHGNCCDGRHAEWL